MNRIRTISTAIVISLGASIGGTATAVAHGAPHDPRPAYTLMLGVSTTSPEVGDTVSIEGTVRPAAPGETIRLQAAFNGRRHWKTIDTVKLTRRGSFKFKSKVETSRTRLYRAVMVRSGFTWASNAQKVWVFDWVTLGSLGSVGFSFGDAVIGGVRYPDSLIATGAPTQTAMWHAPAGYRCYGLRGVLGLSDSSSPGSNGVVTIGNLAIPLTTGPALPFTMHVEGGYLPISARSSDGGIPVVGSAEGFCTS